jgi:hypothetical protein
MSLRPHPRIHPVPRPRSRPLEECVQQKTTSAVTVPAGRSALASLGFANPLKTGVPPARMWTAGAAASCRTVNWPLPAATFETSFGYGVSTGCRHLQVIAALRKLDRVGERARLEVGQQHLAVGIDVKGAPGTACSTETVAVADGRSGAVAAGTPTSNRPAAVRAVTRRTDHITEQWGFINESWRFSVA